MLGLKIRIRGERPARPLPGTAYKEEDCLQDILNELHYKSHVRKLVSDSGKSMTIVPTEILKRSVLDSNQLAGHYKILLCIY